MKWLCSVLRNVNEARKIDRDRRCVMTDGQDMQSAAISTKAVGAVLERLETRWQLEAQ